MCMSGLTVCRGPLANAGAIGGCFGWSLTGTFLNFSHSTRQAINRRIGRESLSYCLSLMPGPKNPLDPTYIRVSRWMRSLGSSRANSLSQEAKTIVCPVFTGYQPLPTSSFKLQASLVTNRTLWAYQIVTSGVRVLDKSPVPFNRPIVHCQAAILSEP